MWDGSALLLVGPNRDWSTRRDGATATHRAGRAHKTDTTIPYSLSLSLCVLYRAVCPKSPTADLKEPHTTKKKRKKKCWREKKVKTSSSSISVTLNWQTSFWLVVDGWHSSLSIRGLVVHLLSTLLLVVIWLWMAFFNSLSPESHRLGIEICLSRTFFFFIFTPPVTHNSQRSIYTIYIHLAAIFLFSPSFNYFHLDFSIFQLWVFSCRVRETISRNQLQISHTGSRSWLPRFKNNYIVLSNGYKTADVTSFGEECEIREPRVGNRFLAPWSIWTHQWMAIMCVV